MSASLVGSEMCIRDSACRARLHSRAPARMRSHRDAIWLSRWHRGERATAVSYTHLTLPTICSV
eukprot:5822002-Alexandrium_andersonii.AAC.1